MDRSPFLPFCSSFRSALPAGLSFLSDPHRRVLDGLADGARKPGSVLVLTGDPGVGKSTLAHKVAARCEPALRIGRIGHSRAQLIGLSAEVPKALGLSEAMAPDGADGGAAALRDACRDAGGGFLLIVDEAQALSDAGLDYLAALTAPGPQACPIAVLLVDGGGLDKRLASPRHDNLRIRIAGRFRLSPFEAGDTADYIAHRFRVSGCSCHAGIQVFDPAALRHLHVMSAGFPRVINALVQACLFEARSDGRSSMDAAFVRSCLSAMVAEGRFTHLLSSVSTLSRTYPALQEPRPGPAPGTAIPPADSARTGVFAAVDSVNLRESGTRDGPEPQTMPHPGSGHPAGHLHPWARVWGTGLAAAAVGVLILGLLEHRRTPVETVATASILPLGSSETIPETDGPQIAALAVPAPPATVAPPAPAPVARLSGPTPSTGRPLPGRVAVEPVPDPDRLLSEALAIGGVDPARAAHLYASAAVWGSDRAAYYLGQLYETGVGVAADPGRAQVWYEQAPDMAGAAARLADLKAGGASEPSPVATPVPVRQTLFGHGQTELHWQAAAGTVPRYRVEFVVAGSEGQIQSRETVVSSVLIPQPVMRWRIVALHRNGSDGPASAWSRLVPGAR